MSQFLVLERQVEIAQWLAGILHHLGAYDWLVQHGLPGLLGHCRCVPMEKRQPCPEWPEGLRHLDTVMTVAREVRERVLQALEEARCPVVIGGDHSVSMGTLAALGEYFSPAEVAVVYIDGHTDINTDRTSVTGCIHGMDLAAACGLCCDELTVGSQKVNVFGKNIHIIGARSIDPPEYAIVEEQGVHLCPAEEVLADPDGLLEKLLPRLEGKRIHISFDVDSMDPGAFRATGYQLPGGLTLEQAERIMERVLSTGQVCSFECVEYNPLLDPDGQDGAKLAALLGRLLG